MLKSDDQFTNYFWSNKVTWSSYFAQKFIFQVLSIKENVRRIIEIQYKLQTLQYISLALNLPYTFKFVKLKVCNFFVLLKQPVQNIFKQRMQWLVVKN